MLETPEERIKLLRKGFTGKEIETLYNKFNNIKIVNTPINFEIIEFDLPQNKKASTTEVAIELCLIF
ncbi:MAG TPA: hypothetical protein VIO58_03780 [Candidatus Methanoperedens sp.]